MSGSANVIQRQVQVPQHAVGLRLDRVAADLLGDFSRSRVQQWISDGSLRVDGYVRQSKDRLLGGETLTLTAALGAEGEWLAQAMELNVIHEDDALLVINKPAGLVVHPGAGNPDATLLNGLLHHCPQLATIPRAGIVHRLDKDTTGLLVIAKTLAAHHQLVAQLVERRVTREYAAVVSGVVAGPGELHAQMGRHPAARVKMAVVARGGKEAITHYHVVKKFAAHTLIRVRLETGRTHQIRVHMAHIGHPLVGDSLYGGRLRRLAGADEPLRLALQSFRRQALHAATLSLVHPSTGKQVSWSAPLPADLQALIATLGG